MEYFLILNENCVMLLKIFIYKVYKSKRYYVMESKLGIEIILYYFIYMKYVF